MSPSIIKTYISGIRFHIYVNLHGPCTETLIQINQLKTHFGVIVAFKKHSDLI
jgi:hypothetical protein